ncbi:MAG: bifunctional homocysteine S-methyltransferase/methylenetetrahydrofolate reductase [Finegoldia sp.]|nr:bifunctional homocysteine S-methyltransferase/methylenetetrahydrofolate reductase [Finegoldia sp.]
MNKLLDLDKPLLFDGAMGTYYPSKTLNPLPKCEMANIFDKKTIVSIHKEYIKAGAKAIKTNTYQANSLALNADEAVVESIINGGIEAAKEACKGTDVLIFADIGQIPSEEDPFEEYCRIADIFLREGINNFLFETFASIDDILKVAQYIKKKDQDSFIISSFAINADGLTRFGEIGAKLLERADECDFIDAAGFNCVSGPLHLKEYIKSIDLPEKTLSIMPNAGYPTVINGRTIYSHDKEYFSNSILDILDHGAKIIGGCCGTNPEFIKEISKKIKNYKINDKKNKEEDKLKIDNPYTENLFMNKLQNGKKPIAVEYVPPKNLDMGKYIDNVKKYYDHGVDAITIPDCPVARVRVDASYTAYKIKREVGIDPVVHMTCRDRNINATKALLFALNIENILNVILVTGDPIPSAEKDDIKSVYQFNSTKLTGFVEDMNKDVFTNKMNLGAALNVNATNFSMELNRAKEKEKAGTKVFYTQPIISEKAVENLKIAKKELKAYIMGGLMPIVSYKNASYIEAEIYGMSVEKEIIEKYKKADESEYKKLAIEVTCLYAEKIKDYVDGFYIITPFDKVDLVCDVLDTFKKAR